MTSEHNKAVVRRFYESFGENDWKSIRDVMDLNLKVYSHGASNPESYEDEVSNIKTWNEVFSDSYYTVENQIAEGNMVATQVTLRAIHDKAEFQEYSTIWKANRSQRNIN